MRILLDTHVLLWWLGDRNRIGPPARAVIADPSNDILFSVASCWEMAIKFRIGKVAIAGSALWVAAVDEGFAPLAVKPLHLAALEALPLAARHGDPFDHLLLSQTKAEGAILMTADREMTQYGVRCVGIR